MGRRDGLLFLAVAVLWGVPSALIKVALDGGVPPLVLRRGRLAGLRRHAGAVLVVAVCDVAAPFTLLTLGERDVSSSLAGILVATTPLFVGALTPALDPASARAGGRGSGSASPASSRSSGSTSAGTRGRGTRSSRSASPAREAAFAAYYALIARTGPTRAAVTTCVAPVFSVLTGAIALGEGVGPGAVLGLALILAGSWLSAASSP